MGHLLAELIPILIYLALLAFPSIVFLILLAKGKKYYKKGFAFFIVACIPLSAKISNDYTKYKVSKYRYPGKYFLKTYPNCDTCVLLLKENNTYMVLKDSSHLEYGNWNYKSGDSTKVNIGVDGQLGEGNYTYDTYFSNKKRDPNKLLNK
jgi:hypothetical protein